MTTSFDTPSVSGEYLMKVNNLSVGLNMPAALKSLGEGKDEVAHGLPPYRKRKAFLVDEYPACPKDWMRSTGRIKSYFVPIVEGAGLWLDLNSCLGGTTHHVAVVVSAQGVNAITGLPCKDPQLEQYKDECPKHKKPFGPDRLCADCGYKWPKGNYLTSAAQPNGEMWLDGFRAEDGFIRQYVFTKQKMRGVAAAIIGEDRVFALGISFFLSKEKRPEPVTREIAYKSGGVLNYYDGGGPIGCASASTGNWTSNALMDTMSTAGDEKKYTCSMDSLVGSKGLTGEPGPAGPTGEPGTPAPSYNSSSLKGSMKYSATLGGGSMRSAKKLMSAPVTAKGLGRKLMAHPEVSTTIVDNSSVPAQAQVFCNAVSVEQLEIAAGAKVAQRIHDDPNSLDFYQGEPEGLIVINYCTEEDADKIIKAGKVDLSGHPEGFMAKIPVGNK